MSIDWEVAAAFGAAVLYNLATVVQKSQAQRLESERASRAPLRHYLASARHVPTVDSQCRLWMVAAWGESGTGAFAALE
jgi:hypothetical protein